MPRQPVLTFWGSRRREMGATYVPMLRLFGRIERLRRRVQRDPMRRSYSDLAITPVGDTFDDALELFQTSDAARQTMERAKSLHRH